ncbi:MAG: hydantoinase/oxoprolinase N-terminal domain-containing protein, partial [Gemmatimonadaceae bacterium]
MRSVGIDVGGTFTDLAAIAPDGTVEVRKVLTTPHEQGEGVAAALQALGGRVQRVVHGTTVATNALLERTGADVVLCATAGFTDLLALRRQDRASLYDLAAHHPAPLVAPHDTVPVAERTGPDGVLRALRAADAADVADVVANRGPGAVAVSLLHAYAHPAHERALVALLRERLPADVDVVASSEVYPEVREYERTATAVAEAYLRPVVRRYLERLTGRLAAIGAPAPSVMSSSGGMRPAADAARYAASLALSGPAGGVVGAAAVLRVLGIDRALTIDIGGTSADVGVIRGGAPLVEPGGRVAGVANGLPRV